MYGVDPGSVWGGIGEVLENYFGASQGGNLGRQKAKNKCPKIVKVIEKERSRAANMLEVTKAKSDCRPRKTYNSLSLSAAPVDWFLHGTT